MGSPFQGWSLWWCLNATLFFHVWQPWDSWYNFIHGYFMVMSLCPIFTRFIQLHWTVPVVSAHLTRPRAVQLVSWWKRGRSWRRNQRLFLNEFRSLPEIHTSNSHEILRPARDARFVAYGFVLSKIGGLQGLLLHLDSARSITRPPWLRQRCRGAWPHQNSCPDFLCINLF